MTQRLIKFASSLRVTVVLLLLLALFGAVGTFGLEDFHKGIVYRGIFALFCLNLGLCGFRKSLESLRDFAGSGKPLERIELGGKDPREALASAGFAVSGDGLRAWRRRWGLSGFALVHVAPLAVALGAFWGSAGGFIATENVYVGKPFTTVYSWDQKKDVDLPFTVAVRGRTISFFPGELKVTALRGDGTGSEPFSAAPGEIVAVPETPFSVRVEEFDALNGDLKYSVLENGVTRGPFSRGKEEGTPLKLRPFAFRGFDVKRVEVPTDLLDIRTGNVLASGVIAVNEPLDYEGYRIYLTAWGEDDLGIKTAGFQITRDPGQELLWAGSVVLALGIFILLFADSGWARREGDLLLVKASPARRKLLRDALAGDAREKE